MKGIRRKLADLANNVCSPDYDIDAEIAQHMPQGMQRLGRTYYWITFRRNGRLVVLGPENSEDAAYSRGFLAQEANFEVVPLPTCDKGRATSMLKANLLDKTQNIDTALRRASHQERLQKPSQQERL